MDYHLYPAAWTGSNSDGTRHLHRLFRSQRGRHGRGSGRKVRWSSTSEWISSHTGRSGDPALRYYALSEILTFPSPPEDDISYNVQDLSDNNIQNTVRGFIVFEDSSSSLQIVYTDLSKNFFTHEPPSITTFSLGGESIYPTTADISWNGTLKNDQKDISACGFIWGPSSEDIGLTGRGAIDIFDITYSDFPTVPFTFDVSGNNSNFKIAPEYNGNPGTGGTRWLYPEQPDG